MEKLIPVPTQEQLDKGHQNFLAHCRAENRNSMLIWWPKIRDLGIPTPKTEFIPIAREEVYGVFDGGPITPSIRKSLEQIREAADKFGYPVFVRSDLSSGKHSWKSTCFVQYPDNIESNVINLCGEHELWTLLGLNYKAIAVREFLELDAAFTAFSGDMPINREFRYFIRDGKIVCRHFYWPEEAFNSHPARMAGTADWKERLLVLSQIGPEESQLLDSYALRVGEVMPEFWSVDFAKGKNGVWYLIDMAVGENSYHWTGCPNA